MAGREVPRPLNIPLDILTVTQLFCPLLSPGTHVCQRQIREGTWRRSRALGLGCFREGSTAAGRPAVLGTKDGGAEKQLWGVEDSWAEDRKCEDSGRGSSGVREL